jgi:isoleucyl-tRNA synthetase
VKETRGLDAPEIRRRSEAFAREYIDIQRNSFRRLGVLGDWENPYLTLSPEYEADIIRVFATLVEKKVSSTRARSRCSGATAPRPPSPRPRSSTWT